MYHVLALHHYDALPSIMSLPIQVIMVIWVILVIVDNASDMGDTTAINNQLQYYCMYW